MCFAHSGTPSEALHVQAGVRAGHRETVRPTVGGRLGGVEVAGSGTPRRWPRRKVMRILDGFGRGNA